MIKCLEVSKIRNFKKSDIKVNSFGDISHLQTHIFSKVENICPFELLKNLHPSPAVCGYPKNEALDWIKKLFVQAKKNGSTSIKWTTPNQDLFQLSENKIETQILSPLRSP